jgi:hypothetical protein
MKNKTRDLKQDLIKEIANQLEISNVEPNWFSSGSQVTALAFKSILHKLAERTGIPPKNLTEASQLSWRLQHKSHEAMLQAIQTINNPTLVYRLESFLFLFINSWELLLKAKIISDTDNINSIIIDNDKSIPLDKALNIIFTTENDPIKENIFAIEQLRNKATHLVIPIVPTLAIRLFQAGIFNYNCLLSQWFNRQLDEKSVGSMIFIISSLNPNDFSIDNALLSKKITKNVALKLKEWESYVVDILDKFQDNVQLNNFAIPIEINVALINNPKKADILASLNEDKSKDLLLACKFQKPTDKYPYSFNELYKEVLKIKPGVKKKWIYDTIKKLDIKNNEEYSIPNFVKKQLEERYKKTGILPKGTTYIYNRKAIELIISKCN